MSCQIVRHRNFTAVFLILLLFAGCVRARQGGTIEWPTHGWKAASPQSMGLDPGYFSEMERYINGNLPSVHSVVVVYKGRIVYEGYFSNSGPSYGATDLHPIASDTKSITATLIGQLIETGKIRSLDQKVLAFFPEYAHVNPDPRIEQLTLRHLMTFTTGLSYVEWSEFEAYRSSPDWNAWFLSRPFAYDPGTHFNYESPSSHLLSSIITRVTGTPAIRFAQKNLFAKLGISLPSWEQDPNGNSTGGWGISMLPRDMAKIGFLMLNDGVWAGRRLLPEGWVAMVSSVNSRGSFPPHRSSYGYNWWVANDTSTPVYYAGGMGGQFICIAGELDLVVAITSYWDRHHEENRSIIDRFLYPAIVNARTAD